MTPANAARGCGCRLLLVAMLVRTVSCAVATPTLDDSPYRAGHAEAFAQDCLSKQSFGVANYTYPADAEEHYEALHRGYAELWKTRLDGHSVFHNWDGVETMVWKPEILRREAAQRFPGREPEALPMKEVFGPYIPLFFQWTRIHRAKHPDATEGDEPRRGNKYPEAFLRFLHENLRKDVLYITVAQSSEGIAGQCEISHAQFPNVLVLSAGGYGHVPLPLFPKPRSDMGTAKPNVSVAERPYLISYVGSIKHSPYRLRPKIRDAVANASATLGFQSVPHYMGSEWKEIMKQSRVSLAPRGFGRTAYHLLETMRAGLVPVHVYSDVPWVPYQSLFEKDIGFVVHVDALPAFLERLHAFLTPEAIAQREAKLPRIVDSFFTFEAVVVQILRLMLGQDHALECGKLPPSVRGDLKREAKVFRDRRKGGTSVFHPKEACVDESE